jgi:hypothetical protein
MLLPALLFHLPCSAHTFVVPNGERPLRHTPPARHARTQRGRVELSVEVVDGA